MTAIYTCGTCGVVTVAPQQVCHPVAQSGKSEYCNTAPERGALCDTMREQIAYVCGKCGRPAEQAELLCKPLITG